MRSIPLVILAGSGGQPARLPESGSALHPLTEYKGAALRVRGRPLIEHLVERVGATEGFGPVTVTGPRRVYGPLGLAAEVLDSDGSVAANLRASIDHCAPGDGPMAVMACDVLPTAEELGALRRLYERGPSSFWLPFVRKPSDPDQLGVFAWKPSYRLVCSHGEEPVEILPAHLCIFEPATLRLPLLYRLMDAAYRTRNRPVSSRLAALLSRALLGLLAIDLGLLVRLRPPTRTVTSVRNGVRLAREVRAGRLQVDELRRIVGTIFLRERLRDSSLEECISFPIVDVLSLAEDVDTEEEARALEEGQ